jgi:hypothetical protein
VIGGRRADALTLRAISAVAASYQPRRSRFAFPPARNWSGVNCSGSSFVLDITGAGRLYFAPMCPPPAATDLAERVSATLRGTVAQAAGNRPAGVLVSLLLALLKTFFTGLAELIERIKAGDYQPRPEAPRQAQANPRPRQKPGRRHAADGAFWQLGTSPRDPEVAAPAAAVPAPAAKLPRPDRGTSRLAPPAHTRPGIARPHPPPQRRKSRHEPASWHAAFVPL